MNGKIVDEKNKCGETETRTELLTEFILMSVG